MGHRKTGKASHFFNELWYNTKTRQYDTKPRQEHYQEENYKIASFMYIDSRILKNIRNENKQ